MTDPLTIRGYTFKNRIVRSAIGGQLADSDGSVTPAFANFERRFASTGVSALVSATVNVDEDRSSPLYYAHIPDEAPAPAGHVGFESTHVHLGNDRFVRTLGHAMAKVKRGMRCLYILQIGDPGYHTQTSLFPQAEDGKTASSVFDILFGYRNRGTPMNEAEIQAAVAAFARGAFHAKRAGCDGIEVTASKGYLLQQFLNPWSNRRTDEYGGSKEKRFRLVREVITAVRKAVGPDYLLGVRLSAGDYNYLPLNVRWPPVWPLRHWVMGNGLEETTYFAKQLEELGVDYLHMSNGFGFINPKGNPGDFPVPEVRKLFNSNRHLSLKAGARATAVNTLPAFLLRGLFGIGWGTKDESENVELARAIKGTVRIPVIANGGFRTRESVEKALASGACDMVSLARPLLANPDLLRLWAAGEEPDRPCSLCNRCAVATATGPVGCYDDRRFDGNVREMEKKILEWVTPLDRDLEAAPTESIDTSEEDDERSGQVA
jgi:2,4-dienoyl-CoA reductase (NADPH2)